METDHLREFLVFAETMNYTTAAKKLYISQPTLSSHIASLEKTIGVPLVERTAGGAILTPAGKHLLSSATGILAEIENAAATCRDISTNVVSLNIRTDTAYFNDVLDRAKAHFCDAHPGKRVEFNIAMSPYGRAEALDKGIIDFDIGRFLNCGAPDFSVEGTYDADGIDYFLQTAEVQRFWMTSKNEFFSHEEIDVFDLQGKTILMTEGEGSRVVGEQVHATLKALGVSVNIVPQRFSSLHEYYLTDLGQAFGIISESTVQSIGFGGVHATRRMFTPSGFDLTMEIYTAYRKDLLSATKLAFIDSLRAVANTTPA